MRPQQRFRVLAARVVFGQRFADEGAHGGGFAAFVVVVAGREGGLGEGCDGEILFFGVWAEGCGALVGSFEDCHGAFDGVDFVAGDACAGCLACDWGEG